NNRWQIVNSAENGNSFQIVGNNFGGGYKFPFSINATTTNVGINNLQNATTTLEVNGSFGIVSDTIATTSLYKFSNNG
ncbi:hypothetical protein P4715_15130, partial [Listeria monocytogenes]|nr:hypothetical protein [Listeria monocytogenes]